MRRELQNGLLAVFLVVGGAAISAQAQPETPQLNALRRRVARDRVRARYLRDEEHSILRGLRKIEDDLYRGRREIRRLEERIESLENRQLGLRQQVESSREALAALRVRAGRRAAGMLRLRRTSLASVIGAARAGDRIEARRLRDRFRFALAHDIDLLRSAREASEALARATRQLAEEQAQVERARSQLAEELELTAILEVEREALLEAVRSERRTAERMVRELSAARRRLERELDRVRGQGPGPQLVEGGFGAQRGRLPWPSEGRVEVGFGKKVDPRSEVVLVSQGIDLRAPQNAEVRAIFRGKVAYAGTLEGYGRTLILSHGAGFHSLYAHLERLEVELGQPVRAHQVLGLVGDSGSLKGAYLHFQIRRRGQPVDPLKWLAP